MKKCKVLVVDDDVNFLTTLHTRLETSGYMVQSTSLEEEARTIVRKEKFDAAILDLQLISQDGISLMEDLHRDQPDLPVIILTAHSSIKSAVKAIKKGATNYLTKPFDPRELIITIEQAIDKRALTGEISKLKQLLNEEFNLNQIIAHSEKMRDVLNQVKRVASTDSNIAIYGASGTGKEMIAKAIHHVSPRKRHPLLAINCAAIPETLLESELFGYVKGAFTGAEKNNRGLFGRADKGTLFLDEIGDMYLSTQAKLLRVIQDRSFVPLGSETPINVDVRIIIATNKDLEEEVKKGRFRKDLYYRVHVIPLILPELKERKEDIPLLTHHFINRFAKVMDKPISSISAKAIDKLMVHDWPGNVRELENVIEYAIAMSSGSEISDDLILQDNTKKSDLLNLREARARFERKYLENLLKITRGNVSKASDLAGKYRADLYNLMKKHNISAKDYKP